MRAGIIVIGNEVLSGKVTEINANWLLAQFHELGVPVMKVSIIPDEIPIIAREMRHFSEQFDVVITTGGVGPTHDDMTYAAAAEAFGCPLTYNDEMARVILNWAPDATPDGYLRMALLPQGTELVYDGGMPFPVTRLKNLYIMPGEPTVLRAKFSAIRELFRQEPYTLRRVWLHLDEGSIAPRLDALQKAHPDVEIGSYPVYQDPHYQVLVTFEAKDREAVQRVYESFVDGLAPEQIWKMA